MQFKMCEYCFWNMRIRAFLLHVKTMMFSCDWFKKFDHIWNNLQWSALITSFISLECAKYNSPVFSYRDKKANLEGYKIGFTPVAIMLDPAHRSPLFDSFLILIQKIQAKQVTQNVYTVLNCLFDDHEITFFCK